MASAAEPPSRLSEGRGRRIAAEDDERRARARRSAGGSVAGVVAALALALVAFGAGAGLAPWLEQRMGLERSLMAGEGALPQGAGSEAMARLEERLARLEAQPAAGPANGAPPLWGAAGDPGLDARLERLEAEVARQGAADALAETRLAELAERLALVDPTGGGGLAASARVQELFVLSLARRHLTEGRPLGTVDAALRRLYAARDPAAVEAMMAWTSAPVSRDQLVNRLTVLAESPARPPSPEGGILARARAALSNLVEVRRVGAGLDADPAIRRLALDALTEGDLARAIALFADRPRTPRLEQWLTDARRLRAAEDGLARLETVALQMALEEQPAERPTPGAPLRGEVAL